MIFFPIKKKTTKEKLGEIIGWRKSVFSKKISAIKKLVLFTKN
jgi:hypothetical protein